MMKISVINLSAEPTHRVLAVLRAVNRQIREDFAPYWHISGELRLDSPRSPDHARNVDLSQGDGVIYLVDDPHDNGFGVHKRTADGTCFGFVFLRVCEALREPWSVSLSHEVLELLADPDCNLYCRGPHPDPDEKGRSVFHWFEVCDAVQKEAYEIDGVRVANFVLPPYFTGTDERDGRNDFLMTKGPHGLLKSFSFNPGGYVGFYDPKSQKDEIYTGGDAQSRERSELKGRLIEPNLRRADRRSLAFPLLPPDQRK